MGNKTKTQICITIDSKLQNIMDDKFDNKSKYVEWLIYQDMKKNEIKAVDKINI